MKELGLTSPQITLLTDILRRHPAITRVKVYGSRAKGNYHERSDVDLVVEGKNLDRFEVADVLLDIQSSDFPFTVDLQNYADIQNQALRSHIDRIGVTLYEPHLA